MVFARIAQAAAYAPEQVITNDDLSEIMDTSDEWISSRTGIRRRHITRDETTSDLGTQVVKQLLSKAGLSAVDIDFIIVATITPDSLMPSTAARIQGNIGAVNAFAMDVTAACSGLCLLFRLRINLFNRVSISAVLSLVLKHCQKH